MVSTQSLWAANALWAGAALKARLVEQVPELREVLLIDEIDPKLNAPRQMPAAVVLFYRMTPTPDQVRGQTLVQQEWIVALAVRSAAPDADRISAQAGPLISKVVKALQGWTPAGQLRSFAWRPGMQPNYGRDVTYWPLVFSLQVVTA